MNYRNPLAIFFKMDFFIEFFDNFWQVAEIPTSFLYNAGMEIPFMMKGRPSEVPWASLFTSVSEGRAQALASLIVVWGSFLSCTARVTAIILGERSCLIRKVLDFCEGQHGTFWKSQALAGQSDHFSLVPFINVWAIHYTTVKASNESSFHSLFCFWFSRRPYLSDLVLSWMSVVKQKHHLLLLFGKKLYSSTLDWDTKLNWNL